MNCSQHKRKHECLGKTPAACVLYQGKLPDYSKLKEETCVVTEETTEELYDLVTELRELINLDKFEKKCLELTPEGEKLKLHEILNGIVDKLCKVEERLKDLAGDTPNKQLNFDISKIDTSTLVDACGEPITTLEQLFTALLKKVN